MILLYTVEWLYVCLPDVQRDPTLWSLSCLKQFQMTCRVQTHCRRKRPKWASIEGTMHILSVFDDENSYGYDRDDRCFMRTQIMSRSVYFGDDADFPDRLLEFMSSLIIGLIVVFWRAHLSACFCWNPQVRVERCDTPSLPPHTPRPMPLFF